MKEVGWQKLLGSSDLWNDPLSSVRPKTPATTPNVNDTAALRAYHLDFVDSQVVLSHTRTHPHETDKLKAGPKHLADHLPLFSQFDMRIISHPRNCNRHFNHESKTDWYLQVLRHVFGIDGDFIARRRNRFEAPQRSSIDHSKVLATPA